MRTSASQLAEVVGGHLVGPDANVEGACIDSRQIRSGELFVPVLAERDGHDFIAGAMSAGAAAYLSQREPVGGTAIVVDDTLAALGELGRWARRRLPDRVVAITGSVGKTSTKDLLHAVLARRWATTASHRSFNNELGVPLTLVNAPDGTEAVVVEMGARGPGQIERLCAVASPTVGAVTTVGACHTEQFGSVAAVADSKGELVAAIASSGTVVLNASDPLVMAMAERTCASVVTYNGDNADVRASAVTLDSELAPTFRLHSPWGEIMVEPAVRGQHQVANALAAAAVGLALGVSLDDVASGLAGATLSPWRMELIRAPSGAIVINDAYNANPMSVASALQALARLDVTRRIAVLGAMAELGDCSDREHLRIAELAASLGIELITVAAPAYASRDVADPAAAAELIGPLGPGDAVLVKASRAAALENLAAGLAAGPVTLGKR